MLVCSYLDRKVLWCTKVTHCLLPNGTNGNTGGSGNGDFMGQRYWGQIWRQGTDTTTEAQYVTPYQMSSSKTSERKKSKIHGSYKPKKLKVSQPPE